MNQSTPNICCSSNILATVHKMAIMTLSIACGWGTNEGTPQKFQMSKWLLPTDQQNTFTAQQVDRLNMTFTITLLFSTNLLRIRLGIPSHKYQRHCSLLTNHHTAFTYLFLLLYTFLNSLHFDAHRHRNAQTRTNTQYSFLISTIQMISTIQSFKELCCCWPKHNLITSHVQGTETIQKSCKSHTQTEIN